MTRGAWVVLILWLCAMALLFTGVAISDGLWEPGGPALVLETEAHHALRHLHELRAAAPAPCYYIEVGE